MTPQKGLEPTMLTYIQITAKLEEANKSSYTIQSTDEIVSKV